MLPVQDYPLNRFYIVKTLQCCCTSHMLKLFVHTGIFHDFAHAHVRNSAHECTWNRTCTNVNYRTENSGQNSKITFFNWMTLTIKLAWEVIKVNPHTQFCDSTSIGSAMRVFTNWYTHRQTDGSVFITSTTDTAGNDVHHIFLGWQHRVCSYQLYMQH